MRRNTTSAPGKKGNTDRAEVMSSWIGSAFDDTHALAALARQHLQVELQLCMAHWEH